MSSVAIARSTVSFVIDAFFAASTAIRSRGFMLGSAPILVQSRVRCRVNVSRDLPQRCALREITGHIDPAPYVNAATRTA